MCKKCNDYEEYEQDTRKLTVLDHVGFYVVLHLLMAYAIVSGKINDIYGRLIKRGYYE